MSLTGWGQGLDEIERRRAAWEDKNFPPIPKNASESSLANATLGVCEEAGELAHAVLKMQQGIRGSEQAHIDEAVDAVGDICMYLMGVCRFLPKTFAECIEGAWKEIEQRDWTKDKMFGGSE